MSKDLLGKVALVTGSGRGLGRLMAERLAARGASIILHDLTFDGPSKYGEASDLGAVEAEFAKFDVPTMTVTGNIGEAMSYLKDHIVETKEGSALVDSMKLGGLPPSWQVLRGELSSAQEADRPPPRVWAGIEQTLRVEGLIRD